MYALHPRLAATGAQISELPLCTALLKNDQRWPWLILVPRRADMSELHQLAEQDSIALMLEIKRASKAIAALEGVVKVNAGSLGNEVPQLHIHIVGRWPGDAAWPGPVWGVAGKEPYSADRLEELAAALRASL